MRYVSTMVLIAAFALTVGCCGEDCETEAAGGKTETVAKDEPGKVAEAKPEKAAQGKSIGSATMKEDGTIVLQLRAEGPGGMIGDALITYKPDDPKYKETLEHLGGLKPGEEKPVPPWPEK